MIIILEMYTHTHSIN